MSDSRTGFSILWKAAKSVGVDEVVGDIGATRVVQGGHRRTEWGGGRTECGVGEVGGWSGGGGRWEGRVGEVGGWSGRGGRVEWERWEGGVGEVGGLSGEVGAWNGGMMRCSSRNDCKSLCVSGLKLAHQSHSDSYKLRWKCHLVCTCVCEARHNA